MILYIQLFVVAFILFIQYKNKKTLSSVSIWAVIFSIIFFLYPFLEQDFVYAHAEQIELYSTIGILLFALGVFVGKVIPLVRIKSRKVERFELPLDIIFERTWFLFWVFFITSFVFLIISIGHSGIMNVIKGNISSSILSLKMDVSHLYVYISFFLIPCVLINWFSATNSKQKKKRMILAATYVIYNLLFSFTRIWVLCTVASILLFEIRNYSEKKKIFCILIIIGVGVVGMVAMGITRGVGFGNMSFDSIFDIKNILGETDFRSSYYWFDKLLYIDPPYINPIVYLKPFYSFIPRSIWSTKPEQMSLQVLKILDPSLAATGYSTAGMSVLGEGYSVLGYFGMFLWPFLWGIICEHADKRYYKQKNSLLSTILFFVFSIYIVISAQRGDWAQYMVIFLYFIILPSVFIIKYKTKKIKDDKYE